MTESQSDPAGAPVEPPAKPPASGMSNLTKRVLASIVMIAVASLCLALGDLAFWLLAVVVALFALAAFERMKKREGTWGIEDLKTTWRPLRIIGYET